MTQAIIGIDISKAHLDAHSLSTAASKRFTNDKAGHRALLKWASCQGFKLIVFEPTGPYHQALQHLLAERDIAFAKVNPRQARRFAEATGTSAKTDAIDAALLARMGAACQLAPTAPLNPKISELKELQVARQALIKDRTAAKNRAKNLGCKLLTQQNQRRQKQIDKDIEQLDQEITKIIQGDQDLAKRYNILRTIPGIANVTAAMLLIDMPELGTIENKQAANLAGLAPITRQSGTRKGRSFIRGGRASVRQALYMPSLVAIRFNKDLSAVHQRLIAAGKPAKVAITATMRKLLVLANALLRDNRKWQENAA